MIPGKTTLPLKAGPLWKDPVIGLVLALSFASGGLLTFIPATFPIFKHVFSSNLEQLGRIALLYYMSALLFSMVGGEIVGRLGQRRALASTLALIAGALIVIGSAQGFSVILVGAFCLGLGNLSIVVIISTIVTEDYSRIRQSLFSLQWLIGSAGGVVVPAAIGWWLIHSERLGGSWRSAYYLTAIVIIFMIPLPLGLRVGAHSGKGAKALPTPRGLSEIQHLLRNPAMYCLGALNVLHGISNGGMVFFVGQLYQKKLGIDAAHAAYFLSALTGGFLSGRLLLSWITSHWRIPELVVLATCAAVETVGYVVAIVSPSYSWGLIAFGVAGIFGSGDAPSLSSYAGVRFSAQAVTAFSMMTAIGYIGGGTGSYVVGFLGKRLGIETSIWLMPLFSLGMSIIALEWYLRERTNQRQIIN